jgi:hypothetical protein
VHLHHRVAQRAARSSGGAASCSLVASLRQLSAQPRRGVLSRAATELGVDELRLELAALSLPVAEISKHRPELLASHCGSGLSVQAGLGQSSARRLRVAEVALQRADGVSRVLCNAAKPQDARSNQGATAEART